MESKENPIEVARGTIQKLRARQKFHGHMEMECALEIQRHIRAQSELEDLIICWELHIGLIKMDKKAAV